MKERIICSFLILLAALAAKAQNSDELVFHSSLEQATINEFLENGTTSTQLHLIADATATNKNLTASELMLQQWVDELKTKKAKYKNDERLIAHMFYKVHRKLLKDYKPFSSLNHMMETGNYDCLSGTTLYALLLSALEFDFEVIETNYHIYLNVHLDDKRTILLESTDPLNGYIDNEDEIAERLAEYVQGNKRDDARPDEYTFKSNMNHAIDLIGLAGLQYYNVAVNAFNSGDLKRAIYTYEKAGIFYNSPRFEEFGLVLAQALLTDNSISEKHKSDFLVRIPVMNHESVVSAY